MTVLAGVPLTGLRVLTAWTPQPAVIAGCTALGGSYVAGVVGRRRDGAGWATTRTVSFLTGVALLAVVGTSFLAVYDDTLFWARAVQGVVLLLVAPLLLAVGAPLTLLRDALPPRPRALLGQVRRGRLARAVTLPPVVTLLLVVPPFVLYLTGLYPLTLRSALVSGLVALGLLGGGVRVRREPAADRPDAPPDPPRAHPRDRCGRGRRRRRARAGAVARAARGRGPPGGPRAGLGTRPAHRPGDRGGRVVDRWRPRRAPVPRRHPRPLHRRGRPGSTPCRRRARRGGRPTTTTTRPDRAPPGPPRRPPGRRASGGRTTRASPTASAAARSGDGGRPTRDRTIQLATTRTAAGPRSATRATTSRS